MVNILCKNLKGENNIFYHIVIIFKQNWGNLIDNTEIKKVINLNLT
ncbi:hypothetical protein XSR1_10097 [Xenorhabdus szentirmaii DSM 16338]|uniref:Uncharacterized protein n=1 Tax=Xenorhabdus szentirmaii DSM 16338 TaxID=1427518 RepID=W1IQ47_9GAMM|nr:hypothetical protein XSR1_10097 [Xenorhabdus szentirmaii DSM 16338]